MFPEKLNAWVHVRKKGKNLRVYINQLEYCEVTSAFPACLYKNVDLFVDRGLVDEPESVFKCFATQGY